MTMKLVFAVVVLLAVSTVASVVYAQERDFASEESVEPAAIVRALHTVIEIIQEVTQKHAAAPISDQLGLLTSRLDLVTSGFGGFRPDASFVSEDNLSDVLRGISHDLERLVRVLRQIDETQLAEELDLVINDLDDAVYQVEALERGESIDPDWLAPGTCAEDNQSYSHRRNKDERFGNRSERERGRVRRDDDHSGTTAGDSWNWNRYEYDWRRRSRAFVGEFSQRWPFEETGIYRSIPGIRYNRVEGLVLGVRRLPIEWSDFERGRVYGQVGYALSLDDIRYEAGAESRLGSSHRNRNFDVKIGGAYRKNTATRDSWKSSWAENTVAASLFRHDFFDYFETEGWTGYVIGRVTPYLQYSAGYRNDEYRSLGNSTTWSLFGGDPFRVNPAIEEGTMRSLVFALEGGSVRALKFNPSGIAFRLEAEIGSGLGGDFSFNRYQADLRSYVRLRRQAGFSFRLRGGFGDGNLPLQKSFTLGGIGTVRGYPQNIFYGSRMLLANVEYALYDAALLDDILDDLTVLGLFDAGWTNAASVNKFSFDDVISSAGFGLALDDRNIRLEMMWPLRDMGTGSEPSLWLRLTPTF